MTSKQPYTLPAGKLVWSVVLALVVGALLPVITVLQITLLMPVLMLGGVFTVYLQCYGGWVPAGVFLAAGMVSTAWFAGTEAMWMVLAAGMAPALLTLRGIALKRPFFEQMRASLACYILGLMAAMGIAYAGFGAGMVARLRDGLRAQFALMPDAAFQPLVDAVNSALGLGGMRGMGLITVQIYRGQIAGILDLMQTTYAQTLPGTLLSGAMLTAMASVLWGNWTLARRGLATNDSFVGMSRWHLPGQIALGALALFAVGYVISASGYASGDTVYLTVYQLVSVLFAVQGLAAIDRRMLNASRSLNRRRAALALLIIGALTLQLLATFLVIYGVLSALFGSKGSVRLWLEKRRDDHSDHDDFE